MRSLYLRIWLTVLAALGLFALASGWLVQRHLDQERARLEEGGHRRAEAWAELLERSLPAASAAREEQAAALREWGERLRLPMALDDATGSRIAASEAWLRREAEGASLSRRAWPSRLDDGRTLWIARLRPPQRGGPDVPPPAPWARPPHMPMHGEGSVRAEGGPLGTGFLLGGPGPVGGWGLVALMALLFAAVAAGAWPVVRRLTRRLEALQRGVETFGAGALHHRVSQEGRDEVAAVAASFNRAAQRVESLVRAHQHLLANASHELRSPLARLKMAVAMLAEAAPTQRGDLKREIDTNIAELDALVEEVLLASRLDGAQESLPVRSVDLLALAAEEAARVEAGIEAEGEAGAPPAAFIVTGDERLLRRAVRNLLDNARRYGAGDVAVSVGRERAGAERAATSSIADGRAAEVLYVRVCDRGPGVPQAWRERIFEPFQRLPGHAEREGGVGLGLSLVRQIAQRHGGAVRCEAREGGGSCFTLCLPSGPTPAPAAPE